MMIDDYKKAVISDYHKKKAKGPLSLNLLHSTPAKLRLECLLVLNSRPQVKDEKIIRDFFNMGAISNDYLNRIERFDPEKLKPLDNYLKGKTMSTDTRNIELLAWLIDFEPRPYQNGVIFKDVKDIHKDDEEISAPGKDLDEITETDKQGEKDSETPPTNPDSNTKRLPLTKYGIGLTALLITIIGGVGLSMRNANIEKNTTAYICTSNISKKYHLSTKCHGLNNCKSNIVSTTIARAKERGRTLCEIEH